MANTTGKKFGGREKGVPNKNTKHNFKVNKLHLYKNKKGLYILKTHDFYKIGISSNLYQRIRCLNNMNPYGVEIVKIILNENPILIERQIHEILKGKLFNGKEWFKLNESDVNLLININNSNIDLVLNSIKLIN